MRHEQSTSMSKATVAWIWAVVIGVLMGGAAALIGFSWSEALLIGALGGLGAAIFILFFAVPSSRPDKPLH